ncbi:MAG: toll/interleukin-1 receptor domain-containing protein [Planctomycetaceae bacterium]
MSSDLDIFISHSEKDADIARMLITLLKSSLRLQAARIRCTSVDGYRLPGGSNSEEQLRAEIVNSRVLIGLVSPNSLRSLYVSFELGARWGLGRFLIPVLAPSVEPSVLKAPLNNLNALRCDSRPQLQQLVGDVAAELDISPDPPQSYDEYIERILDLSKPCPTVSTPLERRTGELADNVTVSSMVKRLSQFSSETAKLKHIRSTLPKLPYISVPELLHVLHEFGYEQNKIEVIRLLRPKVLEVSSNESNMIMCEFEHEQNKEEVFNLLGN